MKQSGAMRKSGLLCRASSQMTAAVIPVIFARPDIFQINKGK
jgi:hypothetical protein